MYSAVNRHAQDVASAVPDMSPLHVLKTAIQIHQLSPVKPNDYNRTPKQVMPDPPRNNHYKPYSLEQDKLNNLCEVLPDVQRSTLAAILSHEKGNIHAVIGRILDSDPNDRSEGSFGKTQNENRFSANTGENNLEDEVPSSVASATSITTDQLQDILSSVQNNDNVSNVISFHTRANSRSRSTCTATATSTSTEKNDFSLALSSKGRERICTSCLESVDCTFSFCPHCGNLLKKNYRRL